MHSAAPGCTQDGTIRHRIEGPPHLLGTQETSQKRALVYPILWREIPHVWGVPRGRRMAAGPVEHKLAERQVLGSESGVALEQLPEEGGDEL